MRTTFDTSWRATRLPVALLILVLGLLAACDGSAPVSPAPPTSAPTAAAAVATVTIAAEAPTDDPAATDDVATAAVEEATPEAGLEAAGPLPILGPIGEVALSPTPQQGEGPYYPLDKPADRDSDLTVLAGAAGAPQGQVLLLGGYVVDTAGNPLVGAVVEIWQTDTNGVYLHPGDPNVARRDPNFQSYGEAVVGADGSYYFRTILPGHYEPRPQHIHVKVFLDGRELLTTQFYFAGDSQIMGDALAQSAGDELTALVVNLTDGVDQAGTPVLLGVQHLVLRR